MVRRYVADIGLSVADADRAVQQALMTDIWKRSLVQATLLEPSGTRLFSRLYPRVVRVTGEAHIEEALAAGQGVLCVTCQHALGHSIRWWFEDRGISTATITRGAIENMTNPLYFARQLLDAERRLRRGEAVFMAPDGLVGDRGLVASFLGRRRLFRQGFAELALRGRARVVPVRMRLDLSGTLNIDFLSPLAEPEGLGEDAVHDYVCAYIEYARLVWSRDSPNLNLFFMKEHLLLPEQDPDETGGGPTSDGRAPGGEVAGQ
jgi:lauroyl/myristoyl acyltransferase